MQELKEFFETVFTGFGLTDAVDILLVAFVVYQIMKFILETRAEQIFKGILVLVLITVLSNILNLHTLNWLCKGAVALGAVAILIVFQPELRRALEIMGRGRLVRGSMTRTEKEENKSIVRTVVNAVKTMSREKTGALIVFERDTMLEDIAETGTIIDAKVSEQLLGNIFYEGSPLHDGAVIISNGKIYAAGCVLPLSKRQDLSKSLGTRHRAGIGITENSDALVIIVSEETGIISIAEDGMLDRFLDAKTVEKKLLDFYMNEDNLSGKFSRLFGKRTGKDGEKTRRSRRRRAKAAEEHEPVFTDEDIQETVAEDLTEVANAAEKEAVGKEENIDV